MMTRELMTPREVATALRVDSKTVTRWVQAGKLSGIQTPGGHCRLYRDEIEALLDGRDPYSVEDLPASEHWQASV